MFVECGGFLKYGKERHVRSSTFKTAKRARDHLVSAVSQTAEAASGRQADASKHSTA